jgi:hypothetical protein
MIEAFPLLAAVIFNRRAGPLWQSTGGHAKPSSTL